MEQLLIKLQLRLKTWWKSPQLFKTAVKFVHSYQLNFNFYTACRGLPFRQFFFLLLIATNTSSTNAASAGTVSVSLQNQIPSEIPLKDFQTWKKLLHYQKTFLGLGWKSQNDSEQFFLAPNGKTNPTAEWQATWNALHAPLTDSQNPNDHAQCRFPARLHYFKTEFPTQWHAPEIQCNDFNEFEIKYSVIGASLIFSSHYLNNPASAYGHTFLRLERPPLHPNTPRSALLDLGINFAANVPDAENALIYTFKGLLGGYPGQFLALPYYYKVREYNDSESRDLWEYRLNLKPEILKQLVRHLWELGPTYFNYFYFDENCSYHILGLLDAADPTLKLQERLFPITIPTDTVRVIMDTSGLVSGVYYEPSISGQLNYRYQHLNDSEKKSFIKAITAPENVEADASVLDTLNDWLDWKFYKKLIAEDPDILALKNFLREKRSKIAVTSPELIIPAAPLQAPHYGHGSKRFGIFGGIQPKSKTRLAELRFRFALHDLMDAPHGFSRHAQIEMGSFRVRSNQWQELTLIRILSLSPWNAYHLPVSWSLDVGGMRTYERNCWNCSDWGVRGGTGFTFEPFQGFKNPALLTVAPFLEGGVGIQKERPFALTFSPVLRIYSSPITASWGSGMRLGLFIRALRTWPHPEAYYLNTEAQLQFKLHQDFSIAFENRFSTNLREHFAGIYYYF